MCPSPGPGPAKPNGDDPLVDLRPLKREFRRLLPPTHPNRIAVQGEPDFLPLAEAIAKIQTYLRIAASWEDSR
jgi:hypothetical protein